MSNHLVSATSDAKVAEMIRTQTSAIYGHARENPIPFVAPEMQG